jgi:methylthioribose-1-phosphate isomerase
MLPTIKWDGNQILMIDQRKIPGRIEWYTCKGYKDVIEAIQKMVIRGAPAIGVAAAMGLALGADSILGIVLSRWPIIWLRPGPRRLT